MFGIVAVCGIPDEGPMKGKMLMTFDEATYARSLVVKAFTAIGKLESAPTYTRCVTIRICVVLQHDVL
jgi:hypothetical protein